MTTKQAPALIEENGVKFYRLDGDEPLAAHFGIVIKNGVQYFYDSRAAVCKADEAAWQDRREVLLSHGFIV